MIISTSSIKVEQTDSSTKRFRSEFDIQQMIESLSTYGLIQPIVVTALAPPEKDHKWILVAGGRRLMAALYLAWKTIEAVERKDLSPSMQKEIELEENVSRKDITWMEQVEALRQLDILKRKQHGSRAPGSQDEIGFTINDLAKITNASLGTTSQDLQLANDLINDPSLRSQVIGMPKSVARNHVKREKKTKQMKKKIEQKKIELSSNLTLGKAELAIKYLPDESIDLLITDPPWGVEAIQAISDGFNKKGDRIQKADLGTKDKMIRIYNLLIPELNRVMSKGAHLYIFFAPDWYWFLRETLAEHGFYTHAVPLIWSKGRGTMIANPYHYIPSYEMILFGGKLPQNRTLRKPEMNCFTAYPPLAPVKRIHPLQKPFSLISMFIENSSLIGETVFDPFAGSAVVLKAAESLGRRAVGFESDEKNFYAAQEYLSEKG